MRMGQWGGAANNKGDMQKTRDRKTKNKRDRQKTRVSSLSLTHRTTDGGAHRLECAVALLDKTLDVGVARAAVHELKSRPQQEQLVHNVGDELTAVV